MSAAANFLKWITIVVLLSAADACGLLAQLPPPPHNYLHNVRPNGTEKLEPDKRWVQPYPQLAQYDAWWREIAACEGQKLDVEKAKHVQFVFINSATFHRALIEEKLYGLADPDGMAIYLSRSMSENESIVKHEMEHMLDAWNGVDEGDDAHPADNFEVCGLHTVYP